MRELPIIFSPEMVRAILDGRKTQTRRVILPQPVFGECGCWYPGDPGAYPEAVHYASERHFRKGWPIDFCHSGKVGDRLWVQEDFMYETEQGIKTGGIIYAATDTPEPDGDDKLIWEPASSMKRECSRITLEIEYMRIERVQEITARDVEAQGIDVAGNLPLFPRATDREGLEKTAKFIAQVLYRDYWNALYAKAGFSWETNPLVRALLFRRIE